MRIEIVCNLDATKSCRDTDTLTKTIKKNADIFTVFFHPEINASINKTEFLSFLKLKKPLMKASKNSKHNFRPISILQKIPKVQERVLLNQIGDSMENVFSKFECGFRKSYST